MAENKPLIIGIGISGLVGTRVAEVLGDTYTFKNLSSDTGVDITNSETLSVLDELDSSMVLHFAAKTDVDGCEVDKALGKEGAAWKINVDGARNVAEACKRTNKKMLYISTDFVFDGTKPTDETYAETDTPNPVNWYGQTKYEGEQMVSNAGILHAILRLAYPYRTPFAGKKDLVQAIKARLESNQEVHAVTDHLMSPTFIDDFAQAIEIIIRENASGIFHTVGSQTISPYDFALAIAETFKLDTTLVKETTRDAFFEGRAKRPFNLSLNNATIKKLGASMKTVDEGLQELQKQMSSSY